MRLPPPSLIFDVIVGLAAALTAANSSGEVRKFSLFLLFLCVAWVPYDLVVEQRRGRRSQAVRHRRASAGPGTD